MKFSVSREQFLHGLNLTSRAVSTNNTLPILANILLHSEGNKLYFQSTNLEISIRYFIQTDIQNEGKITIPARLFQNYVNLLHDDEISIHVANGDTINVISNNSKTQIKGIPAQDFPQTPTVERQFELEVPAKKLAEGITQVVFSAATGNARPILSGVFLRGQKNELKLVATNSYRLSEKKITLEKPLDTELQAIVPARTMQELGRIIADSSEKIVTIIVSDNQILFKVGNVELTSRLIDGMFPNYEQLIPKNAKSNAKVEKSSILQDVKRVNLFARENNNNIKVKFNPEESKIHITTEATQIGTEEANILANIEGEENEISLNSEFFLDILNALPAGELHLSVTDKFAPILIKHKDMSDYLHIIMPLRI
ncbi:DNA polymerase III subunit beta [Candidatus Peregrinibacteria bacterium]|nr:MAG: DNA polymerase III subunit beta [Candidatus Peregrinibacteria bacterium]